MRIKKSYFFFLCFANLLFINLKKEEFFKLILKHLCTDEILIINVVLLYRLLMKEIWLIVIYLTLFHNQLWD